MSIIDFMAKRRALCGGSGGGGADLSALLETTYTDTLTWDGNMETAEKYELFSQTDGEGDTFSAYLVRIGPAPVSLDSITNVSCDVRTSAGETETYQSAVSFEHMFDNITGVMDGIDLLFIVVTEDNSLFAFDDPELSVSVVLNKGTYLQIVLSNGMYPAYVSKLTCDKPIFANTTIKPELLPETGPLFTFTLTNVSFNSPTESTWTCNKSPDEIFAAAVAGKPLMARMRINMDDETVSATSVRQTSNVMALSVKTADGTANDVMIQIVEYGPHTNEDGTFTPRISGFWDYSTSKGLVCKYYDD